MERWVGDNPGSAEGTSVADDEVDLADLITMQLQLYGYEVQTVLNGEAALREAVRTGWQAGADYYLTKPFDFEELLRYIAFLDNEADLLV